MLGSAVKNIPSSGWQFLKDVTAPVHSPKQTLKGVGNLALGIRPEANPGRARLRAVCRCNGTVLSRRDTVDSEEHQAHCC